VDFILLVIIGFVLGITTIIPGLSVATMAVAFNVYTRLINIIVPNVKKIFAGWMFWLPLVIGGIVGVVFGSKAFTVLFENFRVPTYWFFIGIIIGSIPAVYNIVRRPSSMLPSVPSIVCCLCAVAIMVLIAMLKPEEGTTVYTELTLPVFGLLVLAGALGALAMIIPGISGAFLLLVVGMYRTVLKAVSDLNFLLLMPAILGAIVGILAGAALVRMLLSKALGPTYGAVLGLIAGSVFVLYPGGFGEGIGIAISVVCLFSGFFVSFFMGKR
jgi:putative membrane protein